MKTTNNSPSKEQLYYIQNEGYLGNAMRWLGVDSKGYTSDIRKAGKYTEEQAKRICRRPEDTAWECEYIDSLEEAKKLIIDMQHVDSKHSRTFRN